MGTVFTVIGGNLREKGRFLFMLVLTHLYGVPRTMLHMSLIIH